MQNHGDLLRRYCPGLPTHTREQVAAYIVTDPVTGCWHWPGSLFKTGYGYATLPGTWDAPPSVGAHRVMYATLIGDIPYGYHIHHRCAVKDCWNPFHLEAITPKEHYARHHQSHTPHPPKPTVSRGRPGGDVLLTAEAVCALLGMSRAVLEPLIMTGEMQSIKVGKLRRIPLAALDAWLQECIGVSAQPQAVTDTDTDTNAPQSPARRRTRQTEAAD